MRIRSEAFPYVLPPAIAAAAAAAAGFAGTALLAASLAVILGAFFRDPARRSEAADDDILAPADGRIVAVSRDPSGATIAIFLSVFNVHVTRSPVTGCLRSCRRVAGGYAMAFRRKASQNARFLMSIETDFGAVELSLIAGAVARRIVPWVETGDQLGRGERVALIKFGSRAEVRLPAGCVAVVSVGDRVRAGQSLIARRGGEHCGSGPSEAKDDNS